VVANSKSPKTTTLSAFVDINISSTLKLATRPSQARRYCRAARRNRLLALARVENTADASCAQAFRAFSASRPSTGRLLSSQGGLSAADECSPRPWRRRCEAGALMTMPWREVYSPVGLRLMESVWRGSLVCGDEM